MFRTFKARRRVRRNVYQYLQEMFSSNEKRDAIPGSLVSLLKSSGFTIRILADIKKHLGVSEQKLDVMFQTKVDSMSRQIETISNRLGTISARLPTSQFSILNRDNPEAALASYMTSFLDGRVFIDIGAHRGDFSSAILDAGMRVVALEPDKEIHAALQQRFEGRSDFTSFCRAAADKDGLLTLFKVKVTGNQGDFDEATQYTTSKKHELPEGLVFGDAFVTPCISLESLCKELEIPSEDFAGVKIDTEGADLSVIRGLGVLQPQIVITEFWQDGHVFANDAPDARPHVLVDAMRELGYRHNIVLERDVLNNLRYRLNARATLPASWGNIFFFRDVEVFRLAESWVGLHIPYSAPVLQMQQGNPLQNFG